jgi:hypothetical protein
LKTGKFVWKFLSLHRDKKNFGRAKKMKPARKNELKLLLERHVFFFSGVRAEAIEISLAV